jgi:hypothetical protein
MAKFFLHFEYYDEEGQLLDLAEKINKIGGKDKNTSLHFAA